MIADQHNKMIARLIKPGEDIFNNLDTTKVRLIHSALGIAGEVFEALHALELDDAENFLEEVGDIYFYMGDLQSLVSWNGIDHKTFDTVEEASSLVVDTIKKYTIYGREFNDSMCRDIILGLDHLDGWLQEKLEAFGFDKNDALQHNIDKLSKRYSTGSYSDKQAKERADKQ